MNKQQIEETFRWRKTLMNNYDKIIGAYKSSAKIDKSNQGQFDLFSMGMEDCKVTPKLEEYEGFIDIMQSVNKEAELIGVPIFYNPLNDCTMYEDIYCTHHPTELLELTEDTLNITILDRVMVIDSRTSKKGNRYCKLFLSNLGSETYIYLWGQTYRDSIVKIFINEIYLISIEYHIATKEFDMDHFVVKHIKNIKDVEIEKEYSKLISSLKIIDELDMPWMIKNKTKT